MKPSRFKNPLILAHIGGLVLSLPLIVFLALTYAYSELSPYKSITMIVFCSSLLGHQCLSWPSVSPDWPIPVLRFHRTPHGAHTRHPLRSVT